MSLLLVAFVSGLTVGAAIVFLLLTWIMGDEKD